MRINVVYYLFSFKIRLVSQNKCEQKLCIKFLYLCDLRKFMIMLMESPVQDRDYVQARFLVLIRIINFSPNKIYVMITGFALT
jgi:hypothetical protein